MRRRRGSACLEKRPLDWVCKAGGWGGRTAVLVARVDEGRGGGEEGGNGGEVVVGAGDPDVGGGHGGGGGGVVGWCGEFAESELV